MKSSNDLVATAASMTSRLPKHLLKKVLYYFLFSSLALFLHPLTANAQTGSFSATGSMTTARASHTATLLSNGEVLIAGGCNTDCTYVALATAELYNPATGTFSATGSMNATRFDGQTATLLPNGKVLVAGGSSTDYVTPVPNAELYDPTTGTFSATGSMTAVRYQYTATLLPSGQVLIAGGCLDNGGSPCQTLASAELYNPATGTFSATGSMAAVRADHTATLLPNGKVLVAGGVDFNSYVSLASAEIYDPTTGSFSATGSMTTGRIYQSAALLANGEFLVAGGAGNSGFLTSAELYNPATGIFNPTGSMITARALMPATLLPNGQVLVAGGSGTSGALSSAELYGSSRGRPQPHR